MRYVVRSTPWPTAVEPPQVDLTLSPQELRLLEYAMRTLVRHGKLEAHQVNYWRSFLSLVRKVRHAAEPLEQCWPGDRRGEARS